MLLFLGESAFSNATIMYWDLKSNDFGAYVNLTSDELTTIHDEAFRNTQDTMCIAHVELGSSVTEIGARAFCGNYFLMEVNLPNGLLTIGDEAFRDCFCLSAISIPASVTLIGKDAFAGCADSLVVTVEAGSYGEVWARTSGYAYVING